MKHLILITFFIASSVQAEYMRCSGNITFWSIENNKSIQIKLKNGQVYETDHLKTGEITIGEYQKFPAIRVYPFFGVNAEVINKKINFEFNETSFKVRAPAGKFLNCSIKNESAP